MHYDESLPASRQSMAGTTANPGIKLPAPAWAKSAGATPGGVPPMFAANREAQSSLSGSARAAAER